MDFSGLLLAGGKSKRFRPNKIRIMSGNIPLLVEQVVKLGYFTDEVIISTNPENRIFIEDILKDLGSYKHIMGLSSSYRLPTVKTVLDVSPAAAIPGNIGPIAGIYTGLKTISHNHSLVIAADMPFISFRLLELLTGRVHRYQKPDAVIIENSKGIEALCGIYSRKCIKIIEDSITSGVYKISDILEKMDVTWIGPEEIAREKIDIYNFFNINLPEDIDDFNYILEKGVAGYGTDNIYSRTGQKWKDNFFRGTGR